MKKNDKRATFRIDIQIASRILDLPSPTLMKRWCRATLQQQRRSRGEICIRLVDGRESAALNWRYRHKRGATNVLAFPSALPKIMSGDTLGDLVICAPVVAREAASQSKSPRAHWAHMVVHGTLHLLGHDHLSRAEALQMESIETALLAKLGFDNPYN